MRNTNHDRAVLCYYNDLINIIDSCRLSDADIGRVVTAWWRWAETGEQPVFAEPVQMMFFMFLSQQTNRDRARFTEAQERGRKGGTIRNKRADANENPSSVCEKSSTINDKSSTTDDKSSTTNDKSSTTNDKSSTTDDKSSTTNDKSSTTDDKSSILSGTPETLPNETKPNETKRNETKRNETKPYEAEAVAVKAAAAADQDRCAFEQTEKNQELTYVRDSMQELPKAAAAADQDRCAFEQTEKSDALTYVRDSMQALPKSAEPELSAFIDRLSAPVVRYAVDEALSSGCATWKYLRSILLRYAERGFTTVQSVRSADDTYRLGRFTPRKRTRPDDEYQHHTYTEADFENIYYDPVRDGPIGMHS